MNKYYDEKIANYYLKQYRYDKDIAISEFIQSLLNNNVQIDYIIVSDNVDRDMQQIGNRRYIPEDFIEQYQEIRTLGLNLEYKINGYFNSKKFELTARENKKNFSLVSEDNIEINDLFQKNEITNVPKM